jgi:hypothetical protein
MAYSNQPTFGFSHDAVLNHVDAITDPAHRATVIVQLLQAYGKAEARWSELLNSHPSGLDKRRTQEYADTLGCPPEFDRVVSASYNLTHVWPQKTVPLLETDLDVLNIRAEVEQLYRVIEWDRLSRLFYFDIRRIMGEVEAPVF